MTEDVWRDDVEAQALIDAIHEGDSVPSDGDRLYDALAFFDTRDGSLLADLVRAAREGYERCAMGELGAWDEFDRLRDRLNEAAGT